MRAGDEGGVAAVLDWLDRSLEQGACEPLTRLTLERMEAALMGLEVNLDDPIEGWVDI